MTYCILVPEANEILGQPLKTPFSPVTSDWVISEEAWDSVLADLKKQYPKQTPF